MVVMARTTFIILWYAVCVLACVDTGLFVYPSLSRTLFPALCAMIMALVHAVWRIYDRKQICLDGIQLFSIAWGAYIIIHGFVIAEAEKYMQMYLLGTLVMMVTLASAMRDGLMDGRRVEDGILIISVIHIMFLICQSLGLLSSGNPYFRLTGADENPNITAVALTVSIPLVFRRISGRKHTGIYVMLLAAILLSVLSLRCRTAYLGVLCMSLFFIIRSDTVRKWLTGKEQAKYRYAVLAATIVSIVVLGISGYMWKKDSADGRLFIWQRSVEMVVSSPLGVGYGMFERNYNLYQAEYFAANDTARYGSRLATACGSAYNDILEHGVQGGLAGGLLFAGFLMLALRKAYIMRKPYMLCTLTAVTVMSAVNSVCYSVTPWLITVAIVSLVAGGGTTVRCGGLRGVACGLLLALVPLYILCNRVRFIHGQWQLKEYMASQVHDTRKVGKLYPAIGTSEAYWRYLAECHEAENDSSSAAVCYMKALRYTSSPLLLYKASACMESGGDTPAAAELLRTAYNMLPGNLSLKYHLINLYGRSGDSISARAMAMEILSVRRCKETESSVLIRKEAEAVLNR